MEDTNVTRAAIENGGVLRMMHMPELPVAEKNTPFVWHKNDDNRR